MLPHGESKIGSLHLEILIIFDTLTKWPKLIRNAWKINLAQSFLNIPLISLYINFILELKKEHFETKVIYVADFNQPRIKKKLRKVFEYANIRYF